MDWDKLKIFYAVAEAGSFTSATVNLNLSQSAISRQIQSLEDDLKVKLFERHARGLTLTENGEYVFRNGLKMLDAKVGRSRTTPAEQEESQESEDIAISPIGIPLIAGPGAITATMLLSSQTPQIYSYITLGLSIMIVLAFVYIILRNGDVLMRVLGTSIMRIIQRLMGLILLVIAVQFVINGTVSVIRPLLT